MLSPLQSPDNLKRLLIIGGAVLGVLLVVGLGISLLLGLLQPAASHGGKGTPQAGVKVGASPLLFGTNLDLMDRKNQVFTSNSTYAVLRGMHPGIVRVPIRVDASDAAIQKAMQTVKDLGAQPLVDVQGIFGSRLTDQVAHVVAIVRQVFGAGIVFYEIGNEEDLSATPVEQYVATWNSLVPMLKQKAPQARFVGPVTYRYDAHYLEGFLREASPLPDAISWHEYACDASAAKDQCIQRLGVWSQHISDARQVTQKAMGKELPVMITEWNYAPDASASDGKISDSEFMSAWTYQALQTLVSNHVYAAMQYEAVGSATPLVDSRGTITTQGATMQSLYQSLVVEPSPMATAGVDDGATATAIASTSATATATAGATRVPTKVAPTATPGTTPIKPTPTIDPNQSLYTQITRTTPFYASSLAAQDSGKWFLYTYSQGSKCAFEQGGYGVYVPNDASSLICRADGVPMYSSFAMQVDMVITSGTGTDGGGPSFFDQTVSDNARIQVRVNGSYVLYDGSTAIMSGTSSALRVGLNRTNTVTLIIRGGYTYLYFNGQFVKKVAHAYSGAGKGGYAVYARHNESSTNVVFKNVKLWHA
ncbi:MAG: hypothetical protein J2P37_18445 [Ktedonobacteraceae bacterium]|nr:hypothetical protein [Ktedonobacteraceae bacterium]MBO0791526.1 hypothetical protein [Ktedonobacteraceae bacterium]